VNRKMQSPIGNYMRVEDEAFDMRFDANGAEQAKVSSGLHSGL